MKRVKKFAGKIHLWLGLSSGLIVLIIAITGCIYAFQHEIQEATQPYRYVPEHATAFLPPSELKQRAEKELPGKHVHAVMYEGKHRSAQVIFFSFEPVYYYYIVYANPYTGDILKVKDMQADFFKLVLDGHFYLWLPPHIGQPVVATATLVFVALLLSGIYLWWPRKKKEVKESFSIRWNAKWRRKNYDLHQVAGFYAFSILLVLALTGLVWGFEWFANGVHKGLGGERSLQYADAVSDTTLTYSSTTPAIDKVWVMMQKLYPTAHAIEVHPPETATSSVAANANPDRSTYHKIDYRYFDQYSLEELSVEHIYGRYHEATAADHLLRMNYDIHTGAILGLPGKILAFSASLICATLPITGFLLWLGRNKKKKKKPSHTSAKKKLAAIADN
jgi:uncharacterized iron-regulated membrane protein